MHDLSAVEVRDAVAAQRISAEEVASASLGRIESIGPRLNCFTQVFRDHAIARAKEIDQHIGSGKPAGRLCGVPVAIKDNICLDFGRTTCGSRFLEKYESPYTATAAQRLIDAGAVIVGKTNLDEFAMGSSTEYSTFGPARNPWDVGRVPGGTSGGSAAAVAARLVPLAIGSDTGGSVRQPAALCGVVGLKPTYGRISRYGLVAHASSLDQIGPLAHSVADAALALEVMAGRDARDSTCADREAPTILAEIERPIAGLRIGVPREVRSERNHPAVAAALDRAAAALRDAGAEVIDIELPHLKYGVAAYYIISTAEASSNLARFDGVRYGRRAELKRGEGLFELCARSRAEGFGAEAKRRIMLGTYALSAGYYDAYYLTALKARRKIRQDFDRAFAGAGDGGGGVHAVLMPSTVGPAFRIGEKSDDPLAMYLEDVYTVTASLAGIPAVSVPAGLAEVDGTKLPVGVQVMGRAYEEGTALRIAITIEKQAAPSEMRLVL